MASMAAGKGSIAAFATVLIRVATYDVVEGLLATLAYLHLNHLHARRTHSVVALAHTRVATG